MRSSRSQGFARGPGAHVDEFQRCACSTDSAAARVALGQHPYVGGFEIGRSGERVNARDGGIFGIPTGDIECRTRGRSHGHPSDEPHFVVVDRISPRVDTPGTSAVGIDDRGGATRVDPPCAVQRGSREAGENPSSPRAEPRSCRPLLRGDTDIPRDVDVLM